MEKKYSDITGIILSGGMSSRMGTDKSLLRIGDQSIIERIFKLMSAIFENLLISSNEPEKYSFLGVPLVEDLYKGHGPISGIHAGLLLSKTDRNFFISCDLPLVTEETIRFIAEYESAKPIRVPLANKRIQYLCGVYDKSLVPLIEKILNTSVNMNNQNGKRSASVKQLVENAGAEIIETGSLSIFTENIFFNMNTDDDYHFIKKMNLK